MPRIRKIHEKGYTNLSNVMWRDLDLNISDRGMLGTMLSLPDSWEFSIAGLVAILPDGESKVRASLRRLEEIGYLKRNKLTDEKGRITDWEYMFSDEPIFKDNGKLLQIKRAQEKEEKLRRKLAIKKVSNPVGEKPQVDYSPMEKPQLEKNKQLNTDKLNNYKSNNYNKKIVIKVPEYKSNKPDLTAEELEELKLWLRTGGKNVD